MATTRPPLARGATLDIAMRIPDGFADGYFAGWVPTSQMRTYADVLIATLDAQWVDVDATRYIRLRAADTSAWPIGPARFDIRLTAPDGYKLQSTLATMQITMGATQI
jgi:hypothetical protein